MKTNTKLIKQTLLCCLCILLIATFVIMLKYSSMTTNDTKNIDSIKNECIVHSEENKEDSKDISVDWEKLNGINKDITGWLYLRGSVINYPVVQSIDNDYYLNHDYRGNKSTSGSIFEDYRVDENSNNRVIYGHNLKNGTGFGELINYYKNTKQADKHKIIKYYSKGETHTYALVGAFYADSNKFEFNRTDLSEEYFDKYIDRVNKEFIYSTGITANNTDKLLTLCTCAYNFKGERFVVIFRELREQEGESESTLRFDFKEG